MSKYYKPNHSILLYLNSNFNCVKAHAVNITRTSGGSGYTSAPTINIIPAPNDMGIGAVVVPTMSSGAISAITVRNNGMNYNSLPTISIEGGGNPGQITGVNITNGGSGYTSPAAITATGGGGSGFSGTAI